MFTEGTRPGSTRWAGLCYRWLGGDDQLGGSWRAGVSGQYLHPLRRMTLHDIQLPPPASIQCFLLKCRGGLFSMALYSGLISRYIILPIQAASLIRPADTHLKSVSVGNNSLHINCSNLLPSYLNSPRHGWSAQLLHTSSLVSCLYCRKIFLVTFQEPQGLSSAYCI